MKTDDIFEALTDIDDSIIEAARPLEQIEAGKPMIVAPAPRKPRWKTIVPAAACIAAVLTTTAIGGRYLYTKSHSAASQESNESEAFWYPEEAKYIVSEKITNNTAKLSYSFTTNGERYARWDDESYYAKDYDELAAKSDLIVAGKFVDLPHQIQDPEETNVCTTGGLIITRSKDPELTQKVIDNSPTTTLSPDDSMFNYLQVERVLKGDAEEGELVLINQETSINIGGSNTHIVFARDRLTPMLKGDEWIYFLQKTDEGCYIPVNGPQGRYPMPNNNNVDMSKGEDGGIDEFSTYGNAAPARDEIYAELLAKLNSTDAPEIRQIGVPGESFTTFTVEEFEGVEFKVSRLGVTADDVEIFAMGDGQLDNLFLADLNDDGKRELCATITEDSRSRVAVRDLVSDSRYTLAGKREYFLSVNDNVLNVNEHMWLSIDPLTTTTEPLKLYNMLWTIPNNGLRLMTIDGEATFCLEEYPDISFRVSEEGVTVDETQFGYLRHVIFGGVELEKMFIADITGDGKRELVALGNCGGKPETLAYDIENNETRIISGTADHTVYGNDGMPVTMDGELLTFDMMPKTDVMDYSKVSLEHHGAFTLPDFEGLRFEVDKGYFTSFRMHYDFSRSILGTGTFASEVYFCDIDGDGHREIITNHMHLTEDVKLEPGAEVAIYDVMLNDELGEVTFEGRVIEENGRLLLETASGVSELKYSKSDLKALVEHYVNHISLKDDSVIAICGVFSTEQDYKVEITSGRLKITHNGETLFRSDDELGELCMLNDYDNDRVVFVFTNKTNDCIDAFMLSETNTKLVCLKDAEFISNAPIGADDDIFYFMDGTTISYNSLLAVFEE